MLYNLAISKAKDVLLAHPSLRAVDEEIMVYLASLLADADPSPKGRFCALDKVDSSLPGSVEANNDVGGAGVIKCCC